MQTGQLKTSLVTCIGSVHEHDIKAHYSLLKEALAMYPGRVPSGYFLVDVIMRVDELCFGKLLCPPEGKDKRAMALAQGGMWKKLLAYVRYLARGCTSARDERLAELKKMVVFPSRDSGSASCSESGRSNTFGSDSEEAGLDLTLAAEHASGTLESWECTAALLGLDPKLDYPCGISNHEALPLCYVVSVGCLWCALGGLR